MSRTPITSPSATSVGPYSHGIDDGRYVFCSGQTPRDPATGALGTGGVGAQAHQCFDSLFSVLAEAGLAPRDVVKVNVYLTDMDDFADMNEAYASRFEKPYPARTTVGVASLPMGARIEIELIACRR
jgi:2-iminobutanoate/2-iminopropanoate deaminase